ncbi:IMP dehydrogenase/GMP reductase [Pycnococcus provasolii]
MLMAPMSSSLHSARRCTTLPRRHVRARASSSSSSGSSFGSGMDAASVMKPFRNKSAIKVIAGLMNFDQADVLDIANAARLGGATCVDIAADHELVTRVRETLTAHGKQEVAICVSGVDPVNLAAAMELADMGEIGNYDWFYASDPEFQMDAETVLHIAHGVKSRCPSKPLSVTVPHTLPLDAQVDLAFALQKDGLADIIQTEGAVVSRPQRSGVVGLIEKATPTLAAVHSISRGVNIPVMAASGISDVTAPLALAAGASGVGIGTFISKQNSTVGRIAAVRTVKETMAVSFANQHGASQTTQYY